MPFCLAHKLGVDRAHRRVDDLVDVWQHVLLEVAIAHAALDQITLASDALSVPQTVLDTICVVFLSLLAGILRALLDFEVEQRV